MHGTSLLFMALIAYDPPGAADWLALPDAAGGQPRLVVRVARDGSQARIEREGQLVAVLQPLVYVEGRPPALKLEAGEPRRPGDSPRGRRSASGVGPCAMRFAGDGVAVELSLRGEELAVAIDGPGPCEGPVVRAMGARRAGLVGRPGVPRPRRAAAPRRWTSRPPSTSARRPTRSRSPCR